MAESTTFVPPEAGLTTVDSAASLLQLTDWLRKAQSQLSRFSIRYIIRVFDKLARECLAELNTQAGNDLVQRVAAHTGLSVNLVRHCIEAEQTSSYGPDLQAALRSELGHPAVLDRFVWQAGMHRYTRAYARGLVFGVLPGNIPGLSHLPLMRAVLTHNAFLGKSAGGEPFYASHYARKLYELEPRIGQAVAVLDWTRANTVLTEAALRASDAAIVYGSQSTLQEIRRLAPAGLPINEHGHKIGMVLVDSAVLQKSLSATAAALATDVAMYNQQACLAARVVYVLGNVQDARMLGVALGEALDERAQEWPVTDGIGGKVARRTVQDDLAFLHPDTCEILHANAGGIVVMDHSAAPMLLPALRAVTLIPVSSPAEVMAKIAVWQPYLQNIGLAVPAGQQNLWLEFWGKLGASRITQLGAMPYPSMRWHHDGQQTLANLVRFCDAEGAATQPWSRSDMLLET